MLDKLPMEQIYDGSIRERIGKSKIYLKIPPLYSRACERELTQKRGGWYYPTDPLISA